MISDNSFYVPDSQSMVKSSKARDTRLFSGSAIVCSHGTPLTNFPVTSMLPLGDVSTVLHTGRGGILNSSSSKLLSSVSVMLGFSKCQTKRRQMTFYEKKWKHCNTIKILFIYLVCLYSQSNVKEVTEYLFVIYFTKDVCKPKMMNISNILFVTIASVTVTASLKHVINIT